MNDDDLVPFVPDDDLVGFSDDDDIPDGSDGQDIPEEAVSLDVLRKKALEEDEEGLGYFLPDVEE